MSGPTTARSGFDRTAEGVVETGNEQAMSRYRFLWNAAVMTLVIAVYPLRAAAGINAPPVRIEADGMSPIENGLFSHCSCHEFATKNARV